MKTCTRCGTEKPLDAFTKDARKPGGCINVCKACTSARVRQWKRDAKQDPVYVQAQREKHLEYKSQRADYNTRHYEAVKRYRERKPEYHRAANQTRAAAQMQRTPSWFGELDRFILEEAADLCVRREQITGEKWHIDHDIPLRGREVSGLHVWNNFRVLPGKDNIRKSNHFMPGG